MLDLQIYLQHLDQIELVFALKVEMVENDMAPTARKEYIDSEWSRSDGQWAAFFGVGNQKAFRKIINGAIDRFENPTDYENSRGLP